jgi:nicotinamidase-related amidase
MLRLAAFIERHLDDIDAITLTYDSHGRLHVGNVPFYRMRNGEPVAPFTEITVAMMESGDVTTAVPAYRERTIAYMRALEAGGKYKVRAWPVHCQEGTWGHNLHAALRFAVDKWQQSRNRNVLNIFKGRNMFTEHYSPVRAEVIDPDDPDTDVNHAFVDSFREADLVIIAGEAASHCVRGAGLDLVEFIDARKIVLLSDCMSAVHQCEGLAADFHDTMRGHGARIMRSEELSAHLAQA